MSGLTWSQAYEGGRIVARAGRQDVGAVFPDADGRASWRMWVGGMVIAREGKARSTLAAKSALLDAWADWMAAAGLTWANKEQTP